MRCFTSVSNSVAVILCLASLLNRLVRDPEECCNVFQSHLESVYEIVYSRSAVKFADICIIMLVIPTFGAYWINTLTHWPLAISCRFNVIHMVAPRVW